MSSKMFLAAGALAAGLALGGGAAQAEGELFIYNWSNYIPPELLQKFEQETGIKVTLDVYDSNETMLAKLQAGAAGYDIVVPSDYMVRVMIDEGLALPIDASQMANFENVKVPHDSPPFDPERKYSVPYLWGTTGFSYDSERVPGGALEESWQALLEPAAALDGQIAMLNEAVSVYNAAAYYTGVDKCTESPDEAQKILAVLEAQKPHLAMYQSDGTIDRMVAGEVIAHQQWNGAAHRTKTQKPSVVYVYPKEGLDFWNDNLVMPKGAPNPDNAKTFINWMMAPENIAMASNFAGYMNAIEGSDKYLDESLAKDPAVNMPAEYADRLRPEANCSTAARELRDKVWTRLKK